MLLKAAAMSTRTITNSSYASNVDVTGVVNADSITATTGTFTSTVTAPAGTFTDIRANTATVDEFKEHIVTTDSIIELDSGNTEDKRTSGIVAKYVTGGDTRYAGLLRGAGGAFHLVEALPALPTPATDPAPLANADLTVRQLSTTGPILPVTTGIYSIGSSTRGFNELRLQRSAGRIGLGWSMRQSGQAELHLNANGENRSEITFGTNEIAASNCKWAFNSFRNNEGNHFSLMRGPAINGGSWEYVLHVDGATSQIRYNVATDSSSPTTGAATFAGGVGIAKNLHVGGTLAANALDASTVKVSSGIYLPSPLGTSTLLSRFEKFNLLNTLTGPWEDAKLFDAKVTVIDRQVFIRVAGALYPTANAADSISTPINTLPAHIRPAAGEDVTVLISGVMNAGVRGQATAIIDSFGAFHLMNGTDFETPWDHIAGQETGWGVINISYTL